VGPGKTSTSRFRTAEIDGLPVSCVAPEAVLAELARSIEAGEVGHYVCVANTESMYHALHDEEHGAFIRGADFNVCDGVGVRLAGSAWGASVPRITGPALMLLAAEYGVSRGWRHFFYGGAPGVPAELARRLTQHFPGLHVCGTYSPPFRSLTAEEQAAAEGLIRDAKPDIVWVGLGLPKQERWIAREVGHLPVPWMIGVGAAFNYHSGAEPWAPKLLRAAGLEWLHTLALHPRRRARRYLRSVIYVARTAAKGLVAAWFVKRQS
jgi:N-acetylglucosaminyldiphosphoundecaprenol N-acetyl-beta-D-mannosaminyltransferase